MKKYSKNGKTFLRVSKAEWDSIGKDPVMPAPPSPNRNATGPEINAVRQWVNALKSKIPELQQMDSVSLQKLTNFFDKLPNEQDKLNFFHQQIKNLVPKLDLLEQKSFEKLEQAENMDGADDSPVNGAKTPKST